MGIYDGLLRVYRNLRLVHMNLRLVHMNLRLVHMNLRLVHMNALCFSSIVISFFITKSSSSSKSSPRVRWGPKIINSENLLLTPRRPYLTWQSRKRVDSIKRTQSLQAIGHWKERVIITRRTFCVFDSLILSEGQPIEMKPTCLSSLVKESQAPQPLSSQAGTLFGSHG